MHIPAFVHETSVGTRSFTPFGAERVVETQEVPFGWLAYGASPAMVSWTPSAAQEATRVHDTAVSAAGVEEESKTTVQRDPFHCMINGLMAPVFTRPTAMQ
jgi:hypothetical protein